MTVQAFELDGPLMRPPGYFLPGLSGLARNHPLRGEVAQLGHRAVRHLKDENRVMALRVFGRLANLFMAHPVADLDDDYMDRIRYFIEEDDLNGAIDELWSDPSIAELCDFIEQALEATPLGPLDDIVIRHVLLAAMLILRPSHALRGLNTALL